MQQLKRAKSLGLVKSPVITRVVGYLRVSDPSQAEGDSLDIQLQKITEYCQKFGYELVKVFIEPGVSGSKLKERRELLEMIRFLNGGGADGVVFKNFDRYFREVGWGEVIRKTLKAKGKAILSVEEKFDLDDMYGEFTFQVRMAGAELERKLIFKRLYETRISKVEFKGAWIGHRVPYGWRAGYNPIKMVACLIEVPEEQRLMRYIRRLYEWLGWSQRQIAEHLNKKMETDPVKWGPKHSKELKRPRKTAYKRQRQTGWAGSTIWRIIHGSREADMTPMECTGPERPYGYDFTDGIYTPNVDEQTVINRIEFHLKNGKTTSEISRALNTIGIPAPGRRPTWHSEKIKRILRRHHHIQADALGAICEEGR